MLRAVNKNQVLILNQLEINSFGSISSTLGKISRKFDVPISTLKLNAKILKELKLIDFGDSEGFKEAELTEMGKFILEIVRGDPE